MKKDDLKDLIYSVGMVLLGISVMTIAIIFSFKIRNNVIDKRIEKKLIEYHLIDKEKD